MSFWVGLTGGIGSGKSQAAAEFTNWGVPVIDADAVSRSLTAEGGAALPVIRKVFGTTFFDQAGRLNRTLLRDLVFRRPSEKEKLEGLMFPLILSEIRRQQQYCRAVYGVIDIPLLVEKAEFAVLTHRVLVVDAAGQTQLERVKRRSGLEEDEVRRIMAAQASRSERLLAADDVLVNEGTLQELAVKVGRLHRYYQAYFSYLSRVTS